MMKLLIHLICFKVVRAVSTSPLWENFRSFFKKSLTLSWRRPLSYRNQSIDLLCKSMDWLRYDNGLRHERVKVVSHRLTYASNLSMFAACTQLIVSFDSIAWKLSKCGVISRPYSPVFSSNTGKSRPEITPYLDTFYAVRVRVINEKKPVIQKSHLYYFINQTLL